MCAAVRDAGADGITRGALRDRFPRLSPTTLRTTLRQLTEAGIAEERLELRPDRQGVVRQQLTYFFAARMADAARAAQPSAAYSENDMGDAALLPKLPGGAAVDE